jgi:hypothetical protein
MHAALILQLVCLFIGLFTVAGAVAINSLSTVASGHFLLFLAGVCHLWLVIARRRQYWSLCDIHAGSLLISYFGGSAITLSLAQGGVISAITIAQMSTLFDASVYIVFFCVCLFIFGRLEAPFWRRLFDEDLGANWPGWVPVLFIVIGALVAQSLASGDISLQGATLIDERELPVFTGLIVALSWPMVGICGWILGHAQLRRRPLFFLPALALLPIELVFNFAHGRRVILFQALIFVTCYAWSRGRGFGANQLIMLGLGSLPVVYLLWVVFLALRIEGYGQPASAQQDRDIFTRLESASKLMESRWDKVAKTQEKEVVDRVFVLGYLIDLMENAKIANRYYGRVVLGEAVTAIPRFLLPDKDQILRTLNSDEASVGQRYNIGVADRAMSIATAGYIDFRWIGPVLYAPLAFIIGAGLALMALVLRLNFFSLYVMAYVFLAALGTETAFFAHKLNMMRVIAVLFVILVAYRMVRRLASSPRFAERRLQL